MTPERLQRKLDRIDVGALSGSRPTGRAASHPDASRFDPGQGASHQFLNMTRNTELARRAVERPWVIQRTEKRKGDVVI